MPKPVPLSKTADKFLCEKSLQNSVNFVPQDKKHNPKQPPYQTAKQSKKPKQKPNT